ncbi:MAG: PLDc N-terminal domain-containing protein [Mediterranea sp.]|nr:PLDc N-terminal domain-containing protein [Mediterranea sp.]
MLDIFAIIEVRRSKINDSLKSLITLVILLLPLIGFSVYYIVKTLGRSK